MARAALFALSLALLMVTARAGSPITSSTANEKPDASSKKDDGLMTEIPAAIAKQAAAGDAAGVTYVDTAQDTFFMADVKKAGWNAQKCPPGLNKELAGACTPKNCSKGGIPAKWKTAYLQKNKLGYELYVPGNPLTLLKANPASCCNTCAATPLCTYWQYIPDITIDGKKGKGACYLIHDQIDFTCGEMTAQYSTETKPVPLQVRIGGECNPSAKILNDPHLFRPVRVCVPLPKLIGGMGDKKNRLAKTARRYVGQATGPESIAWDPSGRGPYVSVSDGRILRRKADDSGWEEFTYASPHRTPALCDSRTPKLALEDKCGRPVGMAFHPTTGDLYFADAYYGLFKASSSGGQATKLVDVVDGTRMMMCNDLDIDADANVVYFTDSSSRWARRDFLPLLLEGRKDGRFMKYDIATGKTSVLVDKVAFANGVAISRDKKFVVFCETTYLRCHRYWIRGPKTGKKELFVKLPGYPDNLSLNPRGRFWIALNSRNSLVTALLMRTPIIRGAVLQQQAGYNFAVGTSERLASGILVEVDANGKVTDILEDKNGKRIKQLSEVVEREGKLWLGSVVNDFVGTVNYNATLGNAEAGLTKRWSKKFKAARVNLPPAKLFPRTDKKNRLARATKRYEGEMTGPESIAWDPNGKGPYVSFSDGRIMRRTDDDSAWEEFTYASPLRTDAKCNSKKTRPELETICGRPLGLAFHPTTGDLYFADGYFGLYKVSAAGGQATKLVSALDGRKFMMTNDLDIDADANVVYFTDGSSRWYRRDFLPLTLEGRKDGRFMKYDIASGVTTVIDEKVAFANGVAISQDKTFVVYCETTYLRCHRYWIRGPNTGKKEVFVNLPGYPDNLSLNPRGRFWIALNSRRSPTATVASQTPLIRETFVENKLGYKIVKATQDQRASGIVVEVDADGKITNLLEDKNGKVVKDVSEIVEHDGKLWIGSVIEDYIATLKWP
ncbi:unnamed protein product [Closterium sp. Yama58-4]|nr:unnamed protein product [Closterium sp. Yama58-4]